jgi:hypothetical protein
MFLEKYPEYKTDPRISGLLTRKHLKSVIMIVNYNAGRMRCVSSFLNSIKESGEYSASDKILYTDVISGFHKYLSSELFNEMYQRNKEEFLASHFDNLKLDDADLRMAYQETVDTKEVVKINGDR